MISKDDLVKVVAQKCGVSVESSSFFFEVFVNRLSNKLKPGDLLHFYDLGFFHKRNCRIQLEKSPDSPIPKSYLIQLVIFSDEAKIKSDLSSIHFLKIANLKTLWVDDKDFQKSLASGGATSARRWATRRIWAISSGWGCSARFWASARRGGARRCSRSGGRSSSSRRR